MRIERAFAPLFAALCWAALPAAADAGTAIGDPAPGFALQDLAGELHSLQNRRGKIVVLEWINPNCPFSRRHATEETMTELARRWEVVWLAINSTNPRNGDFLDPAEHLAYNREMGIPYPVLYDRSGEVGRSYGAKTTPHMFVIDPRGRLVYDGAIDDDPMGRKAPAERANYVRGALAALAAGASPDPTATKPYGCSVKY